ncbi:hypothetical protein CLPU_4c02360 [Gottschalkia purinilytica]|uniref:Uncharacterized protein n=1 Tax=Gottschalkia purinilytica TaxID=1503 RepID=A0A0L0WCP9_GOTPU|nr:hypothetical protein [Gottschalkia purinilytica]KNF09190.1 hypothetical protein CLPU_4c02360 [Gottschalkia purinilytica]
MVCIKKDSNNSFCSKLNDIENKVKNLRTYNGDLDIKNQYFLQKLQSFILLLKSIDQALINNNLNDMSSIDEDVLHSIKDCLNSTFDNINVTNETILEFLQKIKSIYYVIKE